MIYFLGFIAICFLGLVIDAFEHRRRARTAGEPEGSIWYHIRHSQRDYVAKKTQRKAGKKESTPLDKDISWLKRMASVPVPQDVSRDRFFEVTQSASGAKNASGRLRHSKREKSKSQGAATVLDEIQFEYPDSLGHGYTTRRVSVQAVNNEYLEGHCHTKNTVRTFRLQRIRGNVTSLKTGEIQSTLAWASEIRLLPSNGVIIFDKALRSSRTNYSSSKSFKRHAWQTAACFVGFRDAKRSELEAIAKQAGWQVRTGFSTTLDVLIAGPLTGSVQLGKAESLKIDVISESDFLERILKN